MPTPSAALRRRASAVLAAACVAAVAVPAPAAATPRSPRFGPGIEGYAPYQGQTICDPDAEPGVLAFQRIVLDAYPFTRAGGIGRDCSSGGQSEHKEGRAWDWGVSASVAREKAAADEVVAWLLARDSHGNPHALARRLGIMYLIWNRRVWSTWGGWETYCVQRGSACYDPDGGGVRHPHTDHVHFSFGWPGARKQTTFWNPARSRVAGVASYPAGDDLWAAAGNGQVFALGGAARLGDAPGGAVAGIAATPSGDGYWVARRDGSVRAFGDAPLRGDASGYASRVVAIAASGARGYCLLGATGRVFAFGAAPALGGAARAGIRFAAMIPSGSGDGYVLVARNGRTFAFGDAADHGGVATVERAGAVAGAARRGGDGYWIADRDGRVFPRGRAPSLGDLSGRDLASPVAGIAPSARADGYWLVTRNGRVYEFGDAPELGRVAAPAAAPARVPTSGPAPGALPSDH